MPLNSHLTSGQPRVGAARTDTVGPRGGSGRSAQARIIPGEGQAVALKARAADIAAQRGVTPKKYPRAALMREVIAWGLTRPVGEIRAQDDVPPAHDSVPLAEKSITYVHAAGETDRLDRQAEKVAPGTSRNALLRKHFAAYLANPDVLST